MTLFSSLRARSSLSSPDEKDHNSDADGDNNSNEDNNASTTTSSSSHSSTSTSSPSSHHQRTPLLHHEHHEQSPPNKNDSSFPLRIKLNDGKATIDFTLDSVLPNATVSKLKEHILSKHFDNGTNNDNDDDDDSNITSNNRYLRLIVRGRMMAPDTSPLESFSIIANDVVHAVLAKEGVRGGQQARMLRRLNHNNQDSNRRGVNASGGSGGGIELVPTTVTSGRASRETMRDQQSLWRRIGIDSNGVVVSNNNNNNDSDEDSGMESSDFEDAHGEIDLEMGRRGGRGGSGPSLELPPEGGRRRRRRRERRGFDRLRSTGMTRDEVTAIRLYFARSVDRYIERRRVMIRASRRLRASLNDIANINVGEMGGNNNNGIGASTSASPTVSTVGSLSNNNRGRMDTDSSNSLLDNDDEENGSNNTPGGVGENANATTIGSAREGGSDVSDNTTDAGNTASGNNTSNEENNNSDSREGEEILLDRLKMEDEWMSTQGPYSEFRMNLNTNNPLLLAAITGGAAPGSAAANANLTPEMVGPAGLFFRSRNTGFMGVEDEEDDELFGGALTPNGTFVRNGNGAAGNSNAFHPYMGPVPSAGTDKDFVWGFILGFFVGFIMLFWVWMPTVPHKQKIGIISGISFQLGLNLLRKSGNDVGGIGAG